MFGIVYIEKCKKKLQHKYRQIKLCFSYIWLNSKKFDYNESKTTIELRKCIAIESFSDPLARYAARNPQKKIHSIEA